MSDHRAPETTSSLKLAVSWAIVGIPLLWGVLKTLEAALKLFR